MKASKQLLMIIVVLTSILSNSTSLIAQGEIHGRIKDSNSGQPLDFVSVVALINEHVVASATSNASGYYTLKPLQPGTYTLKAMMMGYNTFQLNAVIVNAEKMTVVDVSIKISETSLPIIDIREYVHKLIDPGKTATMQIIETDVIAHSPYTDVRDIVAIAAGVVQMEEGGDLFVRGSRSESTQYVIDGVKAKGPFRIPKNAIKEITVLTGGIPAMFGDATGGIIIVTTKGYIGW